MDFHRITTSDDSILGVNSGDGLLWRSQDAGRTWQTLGAGLGHRELVVALLSSLMFAGLHSINALSGTSLFELANTLVYTFAFGVAMYLTLRVTRNLLWQVLLHATTEPAIFLQTEHPAEGGLSTIAAQRNFLVIILGLILVWFVRGRVEVRPGRVTEDS